MPTNEWLPDIHLCLLDQICTYGYKIYTSGYQIRYALMVTGSRIIVTIISKTHSNYIYS
jgi:hypothetical protein